ncbi:RNA helicase [Gracilaria domingensis]|nr:RNA helicase [Gracilaria domingensis]
MSQHTARDGPVQDTTKPNFTPLPTTSSHPIAHAVTMPRARLENNAQSHVVDEQQIRRIREIEQQITADDYQQRSCFDCRNFYNPALATFHRLQTVLEQRSTAATGNMLQRTTAMPTCGPSRRFTAGLASESTPQQRCDAAMSDVANLSTQHSGPQRNQSSVRSLPLHQSQNPESIPTNSGQPQVSLAKYDELSSTTPNSMKRRRVMSSRYTYSHDEIRRLRHYNRSLDPRKLGASAIIVVTTDPVTPTSIHIDPNLYFADMYLSHPIKNALHSLHYHQPSPIQQAAIPRGRFGSDIIAHAKSGTGKTIAFIIIVLESLLVSNVKKRGFTSALVLVPTRELTDQVAEVFRSLSKFMNPKPRALVVKGGIPEAVDEQQLSLSAPHVVIGTPGRVITLIQKGVFVVDHINLLVLDEADRLAESAFIHSVPEICALLPSRRQTVAFSATFEPWLRDMLLKVMRSPAFFSFPTTTHGNDEIDMLRRAILDKVCQYKIPVPGNLNAKLERLTALLCNKSFSLCILFMNDKRYVAKILMHLKKEGFRAAIMNASLDQNQRDRTILNMKQGKLQIIVASDLLARGLDFEDCDLILQLDVPYQPATYLHRVGRAGRYGRVGSSFLLYNTESDERNQVIMLEKSLGSKIEVLNSLKAGNRRPARQPNESRKPKSAAVSSASGNALASRSPQVCYSRGDSDRRVSKDIRVPKGVSRQLRPPNDDIPSTYSSEALKGKKIETGIDTFRNLAPGSKSKSQEKIPHPRSEGNSDSHKKTDQQEQMDVSCAEDEPYDMWDAYARDAYAVGFRGV